MWDDLIFYIAIGFVAQIVDGAIGMAYGVTAASALLSAGVAPATVSTCVHVAEVFTTGTSGLAHWRVGNVDRRLALRLIIPGMTGGAIGAYLLTSLPGDALRPWISAYLLVLGLVILRKALRHEAQATLHIKQVAPLGFCGGVLDAIGGGGWGPIVTSTLLGRGAPPRTVIGSVNLAEFFVTATISATLVATVGLSLWPIVVGLVIGGGVAAPFAAIVTKYLPGRLLMGMVGVVVVTLGLRNILRYTLS